MPDAGNTSEEIDKMAFNAKTATLSRRFVG